MKLLKVSVFLLSAMLIQTTWAAQGTVVGTVKKVRVHQYLSNTGWDKYSWFCLDSPEVIGTCGTNSLCNYSMALTISKDAPPEMFSLVLSAQTNKTEVTVRVNDDYKLEGYCYARWVETNVP